MAALLLGGCATRVATTPTVAAFMMENGKPLAGSVKDYAGAQASIEPMLAAKNLRLVDRVTDAQFIAMVEVRANRAERRIEAVGTAIVAPNQSYSRPRSFSTNQSTLADDLKPLRDAVDKQYQATLAHWSRYP